MCVCSYDQNDRQFTLELLQIFKDGVHRYEDHKWKVFFVQV